MYVLVTTPRYVIRHDTDTGISEVVESGRGNYFGITWSRDGSDLALSHSGVDGDALVDLATYATSEQGYLTIGERITWKFLSAPHQILWVGDTIVVTNTGRNAVAKVNPRDHSIIQRRYDDALWDRLTPTTFDGAHLNSLYHKGDTLYAVAHNFHKGSYILELDWPTLEERGRRPLRDATGIHNFWIDESGRSVVCDSNRGALLDADSSEVLWSNQHEGFTRGLAATNNIVLVGHSDRSTRAMRNFSETGLWILSRADFTLLDYQCLGNFGAVQEVRILDEPDLCHHGIPLRPDALDGLRARNRQTGEARKRRVGAARSFAAQWRTVLGKPRLLDSKTITSDDDQLLLCISRTPASGISGDLSWRVGAGAGHASLVVGYSGPEDQNMAAAIFEPSNSGGLFASVWINDGEWRMVCERRVPEEAIRTGDRSSRQVRADFHLVGQNLELRLWDETFLSAPTGDLTVAGQVGVRFLGQLFEWSDVRSA